MTKTNSLHKLLLPAALGMAIMAGAPLVHAQDAKPAFVASLGGAAKAESTITDAEIRDIISRVVKHNLHALADGEYPTVTNIDQAKAAKAPRGIAWNYPWGVALYDELFRVLIAGCIC